MTNPLQQLREHGQSPWLDYIHRGLINSGELGRMIRDGWITGMTSNPTIFRKAIAGSEDYGAPLRDLAGRGISDPYAAFMELAGEDVRLAADALRPVYEATDGRDGFVSFEAQEGEAGEMVDEVHRMSAHVDRPNVMIKVPSTHQGIQALKRLTAEGVNVNMTLLFSVNAYQQVADAYVKGLEARLNRGQPVRGIASVASFFVSRIDQKVDDRLLEGSPLRGKIAIASAQRAYQRFIEIFSGPRWDRLVAAGARVQRPLWGSTSTKNPAYSDVLYVEELVAPNTVNTMPEETLRAFADHGRVRPSVEEGMAIAEKTLEQASAEGIDLGAICEELLQEGLASFGEDFQELLREIEKALSGAAIVE